MVEHLGSAPSVSWSQTRRITIFLVPVIEMDPATGFAPASSDLQNRRFNYFSHTGIKRTCSRLYVRIFLVYETNPHNFSSTAYKC